MNVAIDRASSRQGHGFGRSCSVSGLIAGLGPHRGGGAGSVFAGGSAGTLLLPLFACDLHDVFVPLVGRPPNAHGMSSWKKCGTSCVKKCGMSAWKVRRAPSKNSACAGRGASANRASTAAKITRCEGGLSSRVNLISSLTTLWPLFAVTAFSCLRPKNWPEECHPIVGRDQLPGKRLWHRQNAGAHNPTVRSNCSWSLAINVRPWSNHR